MPTFVTVAELADLDPGSCVSVEVNGRWVALFNVEGRVYAMDNTCPHAGGPLGEGTLTGDIVECPWHSWRYNVRTGQRVGNPDFCVECFEVRVVGDQVQVVLPGT